MPTPMMLEAIADRKENIIAMKNILDRIVATAEEYFEKQIKQMMEYGHEELNAISPRILRAWQARE